MVATAKDDGKTNEAPSAMKPSYNNNSHNKRKKEEKKKVNKKKKKNNNNQQQNKNRMCYPELICRTLEGATPPAPPYYRHLPPPSPPPSLHPHRLLVLLLLLLLLQNHLGQMADAFRDNSGGGHRKSENEREIALVEMVAGFNATLPCTIRIPANDAPLLTLWYLGEDETPVYSYDQRTGVSGTSWAAPRVFGGRAHYLAHLSPPAMLIMRAGVKDAKLYRCRIDFHNSNSREAWVRLKVVVPPERVEITPQITPVLPGQRDDVVCTAMGGIPSPSVVWIQHGRVVDPNSTVGQSGSYNRLEVPASSEDLRSPFTCQASNNDLTPPVSATYTRNVTSGPTRVILEASENPLVVGRQARITCRALGSNPPAKVTWYHQGKTIQKLQVNVTIHESETISVLILQPGRHHHGRQLLCRAENPSLPLATLEDIITLNVAYRPHVRIDVGWPRRLELLTEGSDLFLECLVDANPPPYKIQFFQNGVALNPNSSEGMMMNDETLAIQHVAKEHSGDYYCQASNVQGDSISKNITINVRYVPVCALNASILGAPLGEMTSMTCVVYAYPTEVNFTWTFVSDSRGERSRIIDAVDYTCDGLRSTLYFTPESTKDFGVFSCYGTNKNGIQQQPCTFTIVPAGPPEGVKNCSIAKVTSHAIAISCQPGKFDGGHPQQFFHQVRLVSTGELVLNKSSSDASLEVGSLHPGKRYVVSVTAFNARGKAPPRSFNIQTLQEAKMHISLPSRPQPRKYIWILGMGAGIILTMAAFLLALWVARGRRSSHTLRNRDIDVNKPNNNAELAGEPRGISDGLCVNGLMQQTIYDSTGRYRGFAHIQQAENQPGFGVVSSSSSTPPSAPPQPEKPSLQSRLSLLRKDPLLTRGTKGPTENDKKGAKETTEVTKTNPEDEARGKNTNAQQETKDEEDDEAKKSGFIRWRWVVNHVSSGGESNRFLDLCRLAQSKHSQEQNKNSESAL